MRAAIGLALAGLALLGACGGASGPTSGGSRPESGRAVAAPAPVSAPAAVPAANAPAPIRLTVAYSTTSATNSLLQLAQDRGIFQSNGLEIEAVYAPGNAGPAAVIS